MGDVRTECTAGTPEPADASTGLMRLNFTVDLRNRTQRVSDRGGCCGCCRWNPKCSASKMHNLSLRSSNGCKARARGVTHCEAISARYFVLLCCSGSCRQLGARCAVVLVILGASLLADGLDGRWRRRSTNCEATSQSAWPPQPTPRKARLTLRLILWLSSLPVLPVSLPSRWQSKAAPFITSPPCSPPLPSTRTSGSGSITTPS